MYRMILFIGLAVAFAWIKIILETRILPQDTSGDEWPLNELSFSRGCSAFELFQEAGAVWKFSQAKIEEDFRRYLRESHVPPYVRAYLRQQVKPGNHPYHTLIFAGGRPPYLY